ncbi:MAG: phospho-sugar mutase [Puniceicoccales bacterium]|jgi:phosphoglucomutase|nr:phospho-sugar mutase [Puniceicoccales bacterium]
MSETSDSDTAAAKILAAATAARAAGQLLPAASENLADWLQPSFLPTWALDALAQLAAAGEWAEINNRFFQKLAFGTGGMRGLTIGGVVAPAERGAATAPAAPEHPAVGANNLNDFTLVRAVVGFHRYVAGWLAETAAQAGCPSRRARLVIAYDVRHFSRHFCGLAASVWTQLGGEAFIFDGPRSTPQLSFTVRHLRADAGIVITASHNPPAYNGVKCYFNDGAQVVPPHDAGIIAEVNAVRLGELPAFLETRRAGVQKVPASAETAYLDRLGDSVLDKNIIAKTAPLVLYTNLHGTGDVMILPALKKFGATVTTVASQRKHDPNFSTVKSPNPEEREAFTLALAKARRVKADIVIGTDPDDDRMGAAVRERDGTYRLVSGNTIGAALAAFRIARMKDAGVIPEAGSDRVALVKTFVTTPLQDAIAKAEGIRCVNTLTGFKWIGAKLRKYQADAEQGLLAEAEPLSAYSTAGEIPAAVAARATGLPAALAQSILSNPLGGHIGEVAHSADYDTLTREERAALLQRHSVFFVFGGEESYGYLGNDNTRDKDANAATLMITELAAWLKKRRVTFSEYMNDIYMRCGYFAEDLLNINLAGADGARRIRCILDSLRMNPPKEADGAPVEEFLDFGTQDIRDADGDLVPKEDFFFFTLADGRRFAVRGSGTEPKIKFYLFAGAKPENHNALTALKRRTADSLTALRLWLEKDAHRRAG